MKKTNIRINNFYIILDKKGNKYYLSDIDDFELWKNLNNSEIKKHRKENVTKMLKEYIEENNISSNVNFYGFPKKNKL